MKNKQTSTIEEKFNLGNGTFLIHNRVRKGAKSIVDKGIFRRKKIDGKTFLVKVDNNGKCMA